MSNVDKEAMRILETIRNHDVETYEHSVRVAILARKTAYRLGIDQHKAFYAGLLHDTGKIFVDKEILTKDEKLSKEEFALITSHPRQGMEYLKKKQMPKYVIYPCVSHHEWKKNPYPRKTKRKPDTREMLSQLIAACDIIDAILSNRSYMDNSLNEVEKVSMITETFNGNTGILGEALGNYDDMLRLFEEGKGEWIMTS